MVQTHARRSHASNSLGVIQSGARSVMEAGSGVYEAVLDRTKSTGKTVDRFVHKNPWQAIAISAGVGLLLGMLLRRRL